jgi:hypothetical protein
MIDRCWREKVDGGVYLYLALVLGIAAAFFLLFAFSSAMWSFGGSLIVVVTLYTFSL